jgi:hypothetical protein
MRARAGTRPPSVGPFAALLAAPFKLSFMAVSHAWLACSLLAGCEFFSTKEFAQKPREIRPFAESFNRIDTVSFRLVESLVDPGSDQTGVELTRRILRFAKAPDSRQTLAGWTTLSLTVASEPPGAFSDTSLVFVRFDSAGLFLRAADSSSGGAGGARYFPLKIASGGSAAAAPSAADTAEFLVLPSAFHPGAEWIRTTGVLEVARTLEEVDTLDYDGHLEESWRVTETVRGGGRTLSRGVSWYGVSGLLRSEQRWDFEGRAADGSASAPKEIRRTLERL